MSNYCGTTLTTKKTGSPYGNLIFSTMIWHSLSLICPFRFYNLLEFIKKYTNIKIKKKIGKALFKKLYRGIGYCENAITILVSIGNSNFI
jgi:hypothetical protein